MINFHQSSSHSETCGVSQVQQVYKPFHVILEDYLNGKVDLPQTEKGSFEFAQESDVDFNSPNIENHHDIFNVAAGVDPVFPDPKLVDPSPLTPPDPVPSPSPDPVE